MTDPFADIASARVEGARDTSNAFDVLADRPRRPMPDHVSYSQISKFAQCARKWYIDKILGIKEPETGALAFGKEFHAIVDNYVKNGIPFPNTKAGRVAAAGVQLLPPPKSTNLRTELDVSIGVGPLPFVGVIDLFEFVHAGGAWYPAITDHKTTSDPKYADTVDTLAADLQLNAYAKWTLQTYPETQWIKVRKNFFLKDPKRAKAWPIETWIDRAHVENTCQRIAFLVHGMIATASLEEKAVPMNREACHAYGGCKYAARCLTPSEYLETLFQVEDARKSPKGKTPVTATTAPVVEFDRETFLRNMMQATGAPPQSVAPGAPALQAPPAAPSPPVANASDPFTLKLINALQEPQIRALGAELIPNSASEPTSKIVESLRAYFASAPQTVDAWIAFIKTKIPTNTAAVNPPEASIAQTSQQVHAQTEAKAAGGSKRRASNSENETALRAACREIGTRSLKIMIDGDKAPSSTTEYEGVRVALKQGAKPQQNVIVNACAAEFDARGLAPAAVHDWAKQGTNAPIQQSPALIGISPAVAAAAEARGIDLPGTFVVQPVATQVEPGLLTSEAERIDKALSALDDARFGFLFWQNPPATNRFRAFAESVKAGAPTHRQQCVHELICDYAGSRAEGRGHGIATFEGALTHWHSICASNGVDPAALAIPFIPAAQTPAPVPVAPPVAPVVETPDPLAGIGNVPANADTHAPRPAPVPTSVDYGETKAPPVAPAVEMPIDFYGSDVSRRQRLIALLREAADLIEAGI